MYTLQEAWKLLQMQVTVKVARYSFSGSIPVQSLSINYVAINKDLEKLPPLVVLDKDENLL